MDSCAHEDCQAVQNVAAELLHDTGTFDVIDIARVLPHLRGLALSCPDDESFTAVPRIQHGFTRLRITIAATGPSARFFVRPADESGRLDENWYEVCVSRVADVPTQHALSNAVLDEAPIREPERETSSGLPLRSSLGGVPVTLDRP